MTGFYRQIVVNVPKVYEQWTNGVIQDRKEPDCRESLDAITGPLGLCGGAEAMSGSACGHLSFEVCPDQGGGGAPGEAEKRAVRAESPLYMRHIRCATPLPFGFGCKTRNLCEQ